MPTPIPKLKALKDGPLTLSLCGDPATPSQSVLAIYRSSSSADAATGVLYQVARASESRKPTKFATYQKWCGDTEGEDWYELANNEDPFGSYLVKRDWSDEGVHKYKAVSVGQQTSLWQMRIVQPCREDAVPEVKVYPSQTPVLGRKFLTLPPSATPLKAKTQARDLVLADGTPTAVLTPSSSDLRKATWIVHVAPDMDARLVAGVACAFRQSLEYCEGKREEQERKLHTRKSLGGLQEKMRGAVEREAEKGKEREKAKKKRKHRGYGGGAGSYVPMAGFTGFGGGGGCASAGVGGGGCGSGGGMSF